MAEKERKTENWTAEEKLTVVVDTAKMNGNQIADYCRCNGMIPEQIEQWKIAALSGYDSNLEERIKNKNSFEFQRRLSLVRHSIYGVYLSSKNEKFVSIHQILNRILILLQYPVCFAIYKKRKIKGEKIFERIDYKFLADPMYEEVFYDDKVPKQYKPKEENNLFQMYGTKFYLMVFVVKKEKNAEGKKVAGFYPIYNKNNDEISTSGDYIRCCLQDILSLNKFYDESFAKSFKKAVLDTIKIIAVSNKRNIKNGSIAKEVDDESAAKVESIISNSFQAYSKVGFATKLLSGASEKSYQFDQPNIILFSRSYRRDGKLRKGRYDYDVRLCVPDRQKKDIHQIFNKMKSMDMDDVHKYCTHYIYETDNGRHSSKEEREKIYDEFKEILKRVNENEVEESEIIAILTSRLGLNARSFSDPVFSSGGVVHFRFPIEKSSLVGGGIEELDELDMLDKRRVILAHYLFESIAPRHNEKDKQLALILSPVEVGGACWGVLAHIIKIDGEQGQEKLFQSQNTWSAVFNFYQHVAQRVQRDLRRDLLKAYLQVRLENLKSILMKIFNYCESLEEARSKLEQDYVDNQYLEKYFPFNRIKIDIESMRKNTDWPVYAHELILKSELLENRWFPSQNARDPSFLSEYLEKEVKKHIDDIYSMATKELDEVSVAYEERKQVSDGVDGGGNLI